MNPRYSLIAQRANHRCEYCHAPEVVFNLPFEIEHIFPVSLGGTDETDNLALACRSCNLRKSSFVNGVDPQIQSSVRLFHPREDRWDEHFEADSKNGEIRGITPVGRATVARLQMNGPAQMAARTQWMQLGLFP